MSGEEEEGEDYQDEQQYPEDEQKSETNDKLNKLLNNE